jgi:hypothetical protein
MNVEEIRGMLPKSMSEIDVIDKKNGGGGRWIWGFEVMR